MSQIEIPIQESGPMAPVNPTQMSAADNTGAAESQEKPQETATPPQQARQSEQATQPEKNGEAAKDAPPVPPAPTDQEQAAGMLKEKNLNIADFEQEFMAQGALSEDSYKKLVAAGIPKNVVDSYIDGRMAVVQTFISDIYNLAGGPEQYAEMAQWAGQNLSPEEIQAFDSLCCSGNKNMITLAVNGLAAKWREVVGSEPAQLTTGSVSGTGSRDMFESVAQVVEAMRDARYGSDPAYTRAVESKMARSPNVFA